MHLWASSRKGGPFTPSRKWLVVSVVASGKEASVFEAASHANLGNLTPEAPPRNPAESVLVCTMAPVDQADHDVVESKFNALSRQKIANLFAQNNLRIRSKISTR